MYYIVSLHCIKIERVLLKTQTLLTFAFFAKNGRRSRKKGEVVEVLVDRI